MDETELFDQELFNYITAQTNDLIWIEQLVFDSNTEAI